MAVSTLDRVIAITEYHSGAKGLCAESAIDQDVRITGDDVNELAEAFAREFGVDTSSWPWDRYAELSEPHIFTGFWFIWRLLTWPIRGRISDPSPYGRLELGHIAAVIDKGQWFEP